MPVWRKPCPARHRHDVHAGETVTLLGRNVGRPPRCAPSSASSASAAGRSASTARTCCVLLHRTARHGIGCAGGARHLLHAYRRGEPHPAAGDAKGGMSLAEIYQLFPNLEERRKSPGTKLSGGEQQMLAGAHPAHRRPAATPRRAHRRPGAGDHPAYRERCCRRSSSAAWPSCWWSRTSASPARWPTASTWWTTAVIDTFDVADLPGHMSMLNEAPGSDDNDFRCADPGVSRPAPDRPDQWLVLRHAQPRAWRSSSAC